MEHFLIFFLFALGLVMIIKGSDWFIDAVIWIASVFKIPYILIGATIVSICTTLPETFVSITAALKNETEFAFGNAMGSIAANTGFILAVLLIFAKPIIEDKKHFVKNGIFLIALLVFNLLLGLILGEINRFFGLLMIGLLILYLGNNVLSARKSLKPGLKYDIESEEEMEGELPLYEGVAFDMAERDIDISRKVIIKYSISFVVGISLVVMGSNFLVDNGIKIAKLLGVPSIVIAVTFTSIGTSLPELVTTISSIRKKVTNLGVGNIIGANILNIIQVIAFSSTIKTISLAHDPSILYMQIPITLAIVVMAVSFGAFSKKGFKRWQGFVLLAVYAVFIILNII